MLEEKQSSWHASCAPLWLPIPREAKTRTIQAGGSLGVLSQLKRTSIAMQVVTALALFHVKRKAVAMQLVYLLGSIPTRDENNCNAKLLPALAFYIT